MKRTNHIRRAAAVLLSLLLCAQTAAPALAADSRTIYINSAGDLLLDKGFTREYGARQIDRTVDSLLKPLLMREMLFGKLRKGGKAKAEAKNGKIVLT